MAAPRLKMTPALAGVLLRRLEEQLIPAAIEAGHPRPPIDLRYGDGLTRADAKALYDWGLHAGLYRALADTNHPDHREVSAFRDLTHHFQFDHPQRPDGSAASWAEAGQPLSLGLEGYLTGQLRSIEADQITPAEAASLLEFAEVHGAAVRDKTSPQAARLSEEMAALQSRATGLPEAATPDATTEEGQTVPKDPAAQERITALNQQLRDPNIRGEARQALSTELAHLLTGTEAAAAAPSGAAAAGGAAAQPADRVAALNAVLRDKTVRGDARRSAMSELTSLLTGTEAAAGSTAPSGAAAAGGAAAQPADRVAALHASLRDKSLRGDERAAVVTELAVALGGTPPHPGGEAA